MSFEERAIATKRPGDFKARGSHSAQALESFVDHGQTNSHELSSGNSSIMTASVAALPVPAGPANPVGIRRLARELPATQSLQAFACAAHVGSFKRAARALNLSPSALSRQIHGLEEQLGVVLFRRLKPGLALTEAGVAYLESVDRVLRELERARDRVVAQPHTLRISTLESFARSWLVPKLPEFERAHPEVALQIEATPRCADLVRDPIDVSIRFGRGPWEGLVGYPLLDLDIAPICSPRLLEGVHPPRIVADLENHALIHMPLLPHAWEDWLRTAGCAGLKPRRWLTFDHVSLALSAAESGQGVLLLPDLLCADRIVEGRLYRPIAVRHRLTETYHFVCRPEQRDEPNIAALRAWMLSALDPNACDAHADAK